MLREDSDEFGDRAKSCILGEEDGVSVSDTATTVVSDMIRECGVDTKQPRVQE